jgi:hypothetical protein
MLSMCPIIKLPQSKSNITEYLLHTKRVVQITVTYDYKHPQEVWGGYC